MRYINEWEIELSYSTVHNKWYAEVLDREGKKSHQTDLYLHKQNAIDAAGAWILAKTEG